VGLAIIHKKAYPNLATGKTGQEEKLGFGDILELIA